MFLWLSLVKEFSDMTKERWEDVWTIDMPTFFNIISFSREFSKRQQEEMRKWQNGLK